MKAMSSLRDDVRDRLAFAQARQKEQYYGRADDAPEYEKNDLVLIFRPRRKKGLAEKLLHNWVGPYKVVKRLTDLNYERKKPGGKKDASRTRFANEKVYHWRNRHFR